MRATRLLRVARNVVALEPARRFYAKVLGFEAIAPAADDAELASLLGVERIQVLRMRLGAQEIELSQCFPAGAAYPANAGANALCFQHIAMITPDIAAAYARLRQRQVTAISRDGPVQLPDSSGGVTAYKFRDPEGHPLEFLQFPDGVTKPASGYDHSAISVADVATSQAFYANIGLVMDARQTNTGVEQDALDGLRDVAVEVVALSPQQRSPHVELLCYRTQGPSAAPYSPADICADRLVFGSEDDGVRLLRDPDGHVVLLDGR